MHEKTKIEGYLLAFSEQGTEGSHWSLQESKNCGYEGLHVLKEGSFFVFLMMRQEVIFCGKAILIWKESLILKIFSWVSGRNGWILLAPFMVFKEI